jgi:hypothetical protein
MNGGSHRELATIGTADEIHVAPDRVATAPAPAVPIWVVRVGDDLYVRSYHGPSGSWYRRARRNGSGRIRVGGVDHRSGSPRPIPPSGRRATRPTAPSMAGTAAATSGR